MAAIYENLNENQWLLRHARNVTSASGEDGILEKIFETIPASNRWCVEFGAWDGKTYSNTCNLMQNFGWNGVFIEADAEKFQELLKTYAGNPRAHCLERFVSFDGPTSLDNLLAQTPIPKDFDLLSIDIDGADYHVWESLSNYQPRVVIVEFNPSIPSHIEFIQAREMSVRQGNSILAFVNLARRKGYQLICITDYNAIFVIEPLFKTFAIGQNSVAFLRPKSEWEFSLFQLYDGTFVVGGPKEMPWHGLPVRQKHFQILPKIFRVYPEQPMGFFHRTFRRLWMFLYVRGIL
jgi:hypothetical protein